MNRVAKILATMIIGWGSVATAQVVISGQVNYQGTSVPYAPIQVCEVTSEGTPCTPVANLYYDYNLSNRAPNPTSADQDGNYTFYAGTLSAPGFYVVQMTPIQGTTWSYVVNASTGTFGNYLPLGGGTLTGPLYGNNGTFSGTLTAGATNGEINAQQQQSPAGTGNNGIAMSLAQCLSQTGACSILAPALYAQTEAQPWGMGGGNLAYNIPVTGPPAATTPGCVTDWRWGVPQVFCHGGIPYDTRHGSTPIFATALTSTGTGTSTHPSHALDIELSVFGGTRDLPGDETNLTAATASLWSHSSGSQAGYFGDLFSYAPGDSIPITTGAWSVGAFLAQNEGLEWRSRLGETGNVPQGTINSVTCGVTCAFSLTQTQGQTGSWANDLPLIDVTQGYNAGYISNISAGTFTGSGTNWDSTYGLTTATTTTTAAVNNASAATTATAFSVSSNVVTLTAPNVFNGSGIMVTISGCSTATWLNNQRVTVLASGLSSSQFSFAFTQANTSGSDTCTVTPYSSNTFPQSNVTISVASSTGFTTGQIACMFDHSDPNWQCAHITAVPDGTHITVDVVNYPLTNSSTIAAGGLTGYGLSMDADWTVPGVPNGVTPSGESGVNGIIRRVYPIVSNASGNTLVIYSGTVNGGTNTQAYTYGPNLTGSGGTATVTVSGGQVTACTATGGTGYVPAATPWIQITGITYTSAPMVYPTVTSGALSGCTVLYAGAGITGTPTVTVNNNPYHIYPQARTTNVYNAATGAVDGSSIVTTPVVGTFAVGDTLELAHYFRIKMSGLNLVTNVYQQGGSHTNLNIGSYGQFTTNDYEAQFNNSVDPSVYSGYPAQSLTGYIPGRGLLGTPYGLVLNGPHRDGFVMQFPPYGGSKSGVVYVGCGTVAQCAAWNTTYPMLNAQGTTGAGQGEDIFGYNPATRTWNLTSGATGTSGSNPSCTMSWAPTGPTISGSGCANTGAVQTIGTTPTIPTSVATTLDGIGYASNLLPNSALSTTSGWYTTNNTATPNSTDVTDPWGGHTALKLYTSSGFGYFYPTPDSPTVGATYTNAVFACGAVGGEQMEYGFGPALTLLKCPTVGTPMSAANQLISTGVMPSGGHTFKIVNYTAGQTIYVAAPQAYLGSTAEPYVATTSVAVSTDCVLMDGVCFPAPSTIATLPVTNAELQNSSITINSTPCTLGGSCTVSASGSSSVTVNGGSVLATANLANNSGAGEIDFTNPSGSTVNAALHNTTMTVNGTTCTLGSTCTVTVTTASTFRLSGPLSNTGSTTSKVYLGAITIPAGTMGATSYLNVVAQVTGCTAAGVPTSACTAANTNTCTPAMYFSSTTGSTTGTAILNGPNLPAAKWGTANITIANTTASTQIVQGAENGGYWNTQFNPATAAINTANVSYINLAMTNVLSTDICFYTSVVGTLQ